MNSYLVDEFELVSLDERIYRRKRELSIKRRKTVKRQKKLLMRFIVSLAILLCLSIGFGSVRSYARQTNDTKFVKNYKSILVQNNDSLESIADLYMSIEFKTRDNYIKEVKSINHLKSDIIHSGNYLIIPYYSAQ